MSRIAGVVKLKTGCATFIEPKRNLGKEHKNTVPMAKDASRDIPANQTGGGPPKVDNHSQSGYTAANFHHSLQTLTNGNQNSLVDMAYFREKKAAPKTGG